MDDHTHIRFANAVTFTTMRCCADNLGGLLYYDDPLFDDAEFLRLYDLHRHSLDLFREVLACA
jgi:hypothetical protein